MIFIEENWFEKVICKCQKFCPGLNELTHWGPDKITAAYSDVIMSAMAVQITSLTIVYSTFNAGADQRKDQSSTSLAFVRGIHRWLVNSSHKGSVTRKMFPFDDVILSSSSTHTCVIRPRWLTHWGKDEIDAIVHTPCSNAFPWMKMYLLWLKFHWSLFPMVKLTMLQHWLK